MSGRIHNILFLCTGNSARSILAEAMLNHLAARNGANVRAYSAGSAPGGKVNPLALEVLAAAGIETANLYSKSWDEFASAEAPKMRVVVTVCDNAANEVCPIWPGSPFKAHLSYPDPSNVQGSEGDRRTAFELTRQAIAYRMLQLAQMPWESMDAETVAEALRRISAS